MKTILALAGVFCAPCLSLAAQVTVGSEVLLPASPRPAHDPCVAFGGDKYLVVWQSGRAEKADLYACRLNAAGAGLDATPFVVSNAFECQERPRAAWGTNGWLVVWADLRNDKDYDVYAARVTEAGQVLDSAGIALGVGGGNQCQPEVAFDGQNWLVVWRHYASGYVVRGARVSTAGQVLDASPIVIADSPGSGVSIGEPRVLAVAGKWLVLWNTRRAVPVGSPAPGGEGFYTSIVTANGAVTQIATTQWVTKWSITAATNGTECLVSWFNGSTGGGRSGPQSGRSYGALRVGSAGQLLGTTDLGAQFVEIKQPAAVWDGKGYMVVYWDGRPPKPSIGQLTTNRIVAHLVASDGSYVGASVIDSGDPNPAHMPAAAAGGVGNTLVVYEHHPDVAGGTILIAARLLQR